MRRLSPVCGRDFFTREEILEIFFPGRAQRRVLERNEVIFFAGDDSDACFYVDSGTVSIVHTAESGKEASAFLFHRGRLLVLSELLNPSPRRTTARTVTPVVLYVIQSRDFFEVHDRNTSFALRISCMLSRCWDVQTEARASLMISAAEKRLVDVLLQYHSETLHDAGPEKAEPPKIRLPQADIAIMIRSTQSTVSRMLRQLQKEGLLTVSRMRIQIHDLQALRNRGSWATPDEEKSPRREK